jgi:hypothetical protein
MLGPGRLCALQRAPAAIHFLLTGVPSTIAICKHPLTNLRPQRVLPVDSTFVPIVSDTIPSATVSHVPPPLSLLVITTWYFFTSFLTSAIAQSPASAPTVSSCTCESGRFPPYSCTALHALQKALPISGAISASTAELSGENSASGVSSDKSSFCVTVDQSNPTLVTMFRKITLVLQLRRSGWS